MWFDLKTWELLLCVYWDLDWDWDINILNELQ